MPRPKRSKVAPSHGAPHPSHPREVTTASDVAPSTTNDEHAQVLENLKRRRDAAMQKLEAENYPSTAGASSEAPAPITSDHRSSSPPVEVGRRERPATTLENPLAHGQFRRRARQSSILGKRMSRARSSSVEVDNADDVDARVEGSVLRQGGIRRRERQPSILGRRGRSSSVEQETDGGLASNPESALKRGRMGRRSRQPSILGTASKGRRGTRGGMYDDTDDFNPDDESTPLKLHKSKSPSGPSSHQAPSSSTSRKRKMTPIEISSPPPSDDDDDIATENASSPPPQQSSPQQVERPQTPEILSETMAPPQSSSSEAPSPPVLRPSRRTNIQPRTTGPTQGTRKQPPRNRTDEDPPSSPPSLTFSPNQPTNPPTRQPKPKPQPASFSTADLQTLLPRRRRRPVRDSFDLLSSEEDVDDEDELSHLGPSRSSRRTPAPTKRVTKLKSAAKSTSKGEAPRKRTYGTRQATSDKENESGSDGDEFENDDEGDVDDSLGPMRDESPETSQEMEARLGKELKDAKRKFEDVDKWELDFEEVTASSSSPADGR